MRAPVRCWRCDKATVSVCLLLLLLLFLASRARRLPIRRPACHGGLLPLILMLTSLSANKTATTCLSNQIQAILLIPEQRQAAIANRYRQAVDTQSYTHSLDNCGGLILTPPVCCRAATSFGEFLLLSSTSSSKLLMMKSRHKFRRLLSGVNEEDTICAYA